MLLTTLAATAAQETRHVLPHAHLLQQQTVSTAQRPLNLYDSVAPFIALMTLTINRGAGCCCPG